MISSEDYIWLISLLAYSDYYKEQDIEWFDAYINNPIKSNQYILERNEAEFFCTYAKPTSVQVDDYLKDGYVNPAVFENKGYSLWVIDFIATPHKDNVMRSLRIIKDVLLSEGYKQCFWLRNKKDKLGWHTVKGINDGQR